MTTTLKHQSNNFLFHCKIERNLSPKTLKAYETDLKQFLQFLLENNHNIIINEISKNQIREYLATISNLKPKSIKRKIASLKALFNFLEFEDILLVNPFRKMRINLKEEKKLPAVMDIKEITKIYNYIYKRMDLVFSKPTSFYSQYEAIRNTVIIELFFITGARVSEIANLSLESINLTTKQITIKGKGRKERVIQICNSEALSIIKQYIKIFKNFYNNDQSSLFINRLGNEISDQSIRGIIKTITQNSGIERHITPHMFRHTFATLLLERDVDIKYIQTLLGHSSIMTTQIYTHVNMKKQRQILTSKHPRKDIRNGSK